MAVAAQLCRPATGALRAATTPGIRRHPLGGSWLRGFPGHPQPQLATGATPWLRGFGTSKFQAQASQDNPVGNNNSNCSHPPSSVADTLPTGLTNKQLRILRHKERRMLERQNLKAVRESELQQDDKRAKLDIMWSLLPPTCPGCGEVYDRGNPESVNEFTLLKMFGHMFKSEEEIAQDAAEQQLLYKAYLERLALDAALEKQQQLERKRQRGEAGSALHIFAKDQTTQEVRELGRLEEGDPKRAEWDKSLSRAERNAALGPKGALQDFLRDSGRDQLAHRFTNLKLKTQADPMMIRCRRCNSVRCHSDLPEPEFFNVTDLGKMVLQSAPDKAREVKETYQINTAAADLLALTEGRVELAQELLLLMDQRRQRQATGLLEEAEAVHEDGNQLAPTARMANELMTRLPESVVQLRDQEMLRKVAVQVRVGRPALHSAIVYVMLVDTMDLESSFTPEFRRISEDFPVVLVATKLDVVPQCKDREDILAFVRARANFYGVRYQEILLHAGPSMRDLRAVVSCVNKLLSQQVNTIMHVRQLQRDVDHQFEHQGLFRHMATGWTAASSSSSSSATEPTAAVAPDAGLHNSWLPDREIRREVFVVGGANSGKSTFINKLLMDRHIVPAGSDMQAELRVRNRRKRFGRRIDDPDIDLDLRSMGLLPTHEALDRHNPNLQTSALEQDRLRSRLVTESPIPGTTRHLVKFHARHNLETVFWDTPGIFHPTHLFSRLQLSELRDVVMRKPPKLVTYRLTAGQSLLLGAMARIDMVEGKPFLMTVVRNHAVSIHLTKQLLRGSHRGDSHPSTANTAPESASEAQPCDPISHKELQPWWLYRQAGHSCVPPSTPERVHALLPHSKVQEDGALPPFDPFTSPELQSMSVEIEGVGWKRSAKDIVFPGLGWVSVSGVGTARFEVYAPAPTSPVVREPMVDDQAFKTSTKWIGRHRNNI